MDKIKNERRNVQKVMLSPDPQFLFFIPIFKEDLGETGHFLLTSLQLVELNVGILFYQTFHQLHSFSF